MRIEDAQYCRACLDIDIALEVYRNIFIVINDCH